jgi:hypothetical protein
MVLVSIVKQTSSRPGDSGLKEDRSCCGEVPSGRGVMVSGTSGFGASAATESLRTSRQYAKVEE